MRYKLTLKFIYLFIITLCPAQAGITAEKVEDSTRNVVMAIIDTTEGTLSNATSFMTARLSQEPTLNLVEREEIDKVLKELELSGSQLVSRENALKVGRLLRADGLVFIFLSDDAKILRVRLVDTRYGLRLLDTSAEWKEKEIERIAEEVVPHICTASSKLLIPPEEEVLIGILGIRNVDPSSTLNWLEITLPGLISSRLSSEPSIIVLEREDLNLVLEEKLFTKGADTEFLGSMALLEGEVEQLSAREIGQIPTKDDRHFDLSLHIKQADGKSVGDFKIEGDAEKLSELMEEIATWLIKIIADSPPQGKWDIKREALRFLKEGRVLIAHGDYVSARPLIETAYALNPGDRVCVDALISILDEYLGLLSPRRDIDPLKRAQTAYRIIELCSIELERGRGSRWILLGKSHRILNYLNRRESAATDEVRIFNKATRRYCAHLLDSAYLSAENALNWPTYPLEWASAVSGTPEEAMRRYRTVLHKLVLPPEKGGYKISEEHRLGLLRNCLTVYHQHHILEAGHLDRKEVLNLWLDFLAELTSSNDPLVKIMAELGLTTIFRDMSKGKKNKYSQLNYDHFEQVMDILIKELNYPDEPLTLQSRSELRYAVAREMRIGHYRSSPEIWLERIEKLLRPLIEKGDMENFILWRPSELFMEFSNIKCNPTIGMRILKTLDSVINTLEKIDSHTSNNILQKVGDYGLLPEIQISDLKVKRAKFLENNPEVKSDTILRAGLRASILCDISNYITDVKSKRASICMGQPAGEGRMLWIPWMKGGWFENKEIGLIGINLEDKSLHSFWHASLSSVPPAPRTGRISSAPQLTTYGITRPVLGKDATYLGIWEKGIVKFPGTDKGATGYLENPEVITEKDGLPSNRITGMARVGNELYVSLGCEATESGFGIYDLKRRQWKTISSSRSKDKSCPLNNEHPYEIGWLTLSPDGKKLFFIYKQWYSLQIPKGLNGLWEMDLETKKMRHIWRTWGEEFHDIVPGEKTWWIRGWDILISFDPYLETGEVIFCQSHGYKSIEPGAAGRKLPAMEKVYIPDEHAMFCVVHSALFEDAFWVLSGGQPWCIFINQRKVKRFDTNDILGESWITSLFPTPHGVVVLGKNKIGLIEENPQP